MIKPIDLTGKRFNRLVGIRKDTDKKWIFKCNCGQIKSIHKSNVLYGKSQSCGCLHKERTKKSNTTHGFARTEVSIFYKKYQSSKNRCTNLRDKNFYKYGGKGIKFNWKSFEEFKEDMYESFIDHVSKFGIKDTQIERIDFNGNYCKENCKWATRVEQARNKSNNRILVFKGESRCLPEWSDILNIPQNIITKRIWRGWSTERALTTPVPIKHV